MFLQDRTQRIIDLLLRGLLSCIGDISIGLDAVVFRDGRLCLTLGGIFSIFGITCVLKGLAAHS